MRRVNFSLSLIPNAADSPDEHNTAGQTTKVILLQDPFFLTDFHHRYRSRKQRLSHYTVLLLCRP